MSDTHGIFIGRFQPVTTAHNDIIKQLGKENNISTVFIIKGKESSKDKELNPFDVDVQTEMLNAIKPNNVNIKVLPTAFFVDEINTYSDDHFRLYAGSDRIKSYERFKGYMDEGKSLDTREIKRIDTDISATKVRDALKCGDETTFKKMVPVKIHKMYSKLKNGVI